MFPPIHPDDPPDHREKHEPWQVGIMISQNRAIAVTKELFPDDIRDGSDCRAEIDREGEPCRICAQKNEEWADRVRQVRLVMIKAFS